MEPSGVDRVCRNAGGNALSVHVAERTFLGGPGSALIGPSRIGEILWQGTRAMYRGVNGTVKVGAANLCGMCFVVVDVRTGTATRVASMMVPR